MSQNQAHPGRIRQWTLCNYVKTIVQIIYAGRWILMCLQCWQNMRDLHFAIFLFETLWARDFSNTCNFDHSECTNMSVNSTGIYLGIGIQSHSSVFLQFMRWKLFVTLFSTVWNRTFWSRYERVLQLPLWKFVEVFMAVSSWCTARHIVQHGSMRNTDWFDKSQDCIQSQIATSLKPPVPPLRTISSA